MIPFKKTIHGFLKSGYETKDYKYSSEVCRGFWVAAEKMI